MFSYDFIKGEIGGNQSTYNAWGHSAGAQFLHRFVFYLPESKLNIAVCSNAGWYTVPESDIVFPYGLSESQLSNSNLISAFSKKLYIHLGNADTDPNSSALRHNDIVDQQQGFRSGVGIRFGFTCRDSPAFKRAFQSGVVLRTVGEHEHCQKHDQNMLDTKQSCLPAFARGHGLLKNPGG